MSVQDWLNKAVEAENQIDAGFVFDAKSGHVLKKHNVKTPKGENILAKLESAISAYLCQFETLKKTVDSFGKQLDRGEMDYALFQLMEGSLLLYFFPGLVTDKNITVGFISAEAEGLGQMLYWGDEFIKKIKPDLEKEFKL